MLKCLRWIAVKRPLWDSQSIHDFPVGPSVSPTVRLISVVKRSLLILAGVLLCSFWHLGGSHITHISAADISSQVMIWYLLFLLELKSSSWLYSSYMDGIEAFLYVVLGFGPTLAALEMSWRMGKKIGKRGEFPFTALERTM